MCLPIRKFVLKSLKMSFFGENSNIGKIGNFSEFLNLGLMVTERVESKFFLNWQGKSVNLSFFSLPQTEWSNVCLKLERAKPSLSALVKRIKYTRSWAHQAIKHMKHHDEGCLYVSPSQLFEQRYVILFCRCYRWLKYILWLGYTYNYW